MRVSYVCFHREGKVELRRSGGAFWDNHVVDICIGLPVTLQQCSVYVRSEFLSTSKGHFISPYYTIRVLPKVVHISPGVIAPVDNYRGTLHLHSNNTVVVVM